jgi:YD repeat-containing protein
MVAVFTGAGTGIERSSAFVLGSRGVWGNALLGRGNENVYVNAANGNLFLNRTDEFLIGRGTDSALGRSYNSLGNWAGETDNWRPITTRTVGALTGTLNQSGSTLTRTDWDGSQVIYTWDALYKDENGVAGAYVATDGAGAYDFIRVGSGSYVWTDGDTLAREFYSVADDGRITATRDKDELGANFIYDDTAAGGWRLKQVTTSDGGYTVLEYDAVTGDLTSLVTTAKTDASATGEVKTITRVNYTYDVGHRLTKVDIDLTTDVAGDGVTFSTEFGYANSTSTQVTWVKQSDNSRIDIGYKPDGKVAYIDQTSSDGVKRRSEFTYYAGYTTVLYGGVLTRFDHDSSGQLTSLTDSEGQKFSYTYNGRGDVLSVTDARGYTSSYEYDERGNRTTEIDPLGNRVDREFSDANQLVKETRTLAPATATTAAVTVVTRYSYDAEHHLRFVISDDRRLTEYRYTPTGKVSFVIDYTKNRYVADDINVSTINSWLESSVDTGAVVRHEYSYDFRDNLTAEWSYSNYTDNATNLGTLGGERVHYSYYYDQTGKLLFRKAADSSTWQTFTYDGMGRLLTATDRDSTTVTDSVTQTSYNDSANKTVVTLSNGTTKTSLFNLAGELMTSTEAGGGVSTFTNYAYDAVGRLRYSKDASGVKTHILYDSVGRKVADISGDGAMAEYRYNANGYLIATIRYAGRVTADLTDSNDKPLEVSLATVRPTASGDDRWEWRIYDKVNRLVETIDAAGAVTVFGYDARSQLVKTTVYANLLTATTVAGYKTTLPTSVTAPSSSSSSDRVTRYFYDDDGLLIGTLDPEYYLSENLYDSARQKTQTIRYSAKATATSGTFDQAKTSIVKNDDKDIRHWFLYDDRGYLGAEIDGEGNLTRYEYSVYGYMDKAIRGQVLGVASLIATEPQLSSLPAADTTTTVIETTSWTHNCFGDMLTESKTLAGGSKETTTFVYDDQRRLLATSTSATNDVRGTNRRYDALGRLTGELSGEGSASLALLGTNPDPAAVTGIYANWGTTYDYDGAGRLRSKREPNGTSNAANATFYYYDERGNLRLEINQLGEVVEFRYNAMGDRTDVIQYGTRLASMSGITGGLLTQTVKEKITGNAGGTVIGIANAALDSRSQLEYDVTGTVRTSTDAKNIRTSFTYNSFRDLLSTTARTETGVDTAANTVVTTRSYDRRGLLLKQSLDPAGLNIQNDFTYDAFARTVTATDGNRYGRTTGYDRAGRIVSLRDSLSKSQSFTYDGRGNVLTSTDRTGAVTAYTYNAFNRSTTIKTPEHIVTTTKRNAYGQVISIADAAGNTTSYTYDASGNLKEATNPVGSVITNAYDKAGRLVATLDSEGSKTSFTYDAANRVLTRKIEGGGLALTTTYAYDAKGQQIRITDPNNMVTELAFDPTGNTVRQRVDPDGVNLTTEFTFDGLGRVTETKEGVSGTAAARRTTFQYDKAGRVTASVVDPGALGLTTQYAYDANGNRIAQVDAAGGVTRFVYDAENRLTHVVDPTGGVTRTIYDANGRAITTRAYDTRLDQATLPAYTVPITSTQATPTAGSYLTTSYVYDADGRLRFSFDALSRPTGYIYDARGNVVRKTEYDGVANRNNLTVAAVEADIAAKGLESNAGTRVSRAVYDGADRQLFAIDAQGGVTGYAYDGNGNVVKRTEYALKYSGTGTPSLGAMNNWVAAAASAGDRVTRSLYDGAGRVAYAVDAAGYVDLFTYDGAGRTTARKRYAGAYSVTDGQTAAQLQAAITAAPTATVSNLFGYDTAGRLTSVTDGAGSKTRMVLDRLGQVTDTVYADGSATDQSTTHRVFDAAGRLTSETVAYGTPAAATTSWTYDDVGRVKTVTDAGLHTTTTSYDASGRVLTVTGPPTIANEPLSNVTVSEYDAFGNLVKVTDPRGNSAYFYYDALGRLTTQVDPELYVTKTTYTIGNEPASVTRYAARATAAPTVGTPPPVTANSAEDAVTTFTRDKLDRVTAVTDAQSFTETYVLDAFGNRESVTNKTNGTTTYVYDGRGLLIQETLPVGSVKSDGTAVTETLTDGTVRAAKVVNQFGYDARGNRTTTIEAVGFPEVRTTTFAYDAADRLIETVSETVATINQATFASNNTTARDKIRYDKRGNVIERTDPNGARTISYYDAANRKVAELSPTGTLSEWTLDECGNIVAARVYATARTLPAPAVSYTRPTVTAAEARRETLFEYDKNNRLIKTTVADMRTGDGWYYESSVADVSTSVTYDAAGNVVVENDGRGKVYTYYDKLGRRIGQLDRENYLTLWTLDADGNVAKEERFANRFATASNAIPAFTDADAAAKLRAGVTASAADDRVTDFEYDRNGRRTKEIRRGVVAWTIDSVGNKVAAATDATIEYTYNGLGQVTSKTEATGEAVGFSYDVLGRQTQARGATFTDYTGATGVRQITDSYYDGLGNVTRTREQSRAGSATERVTTYAYGGAGRLASVTDATGVFTRNFAYDVAGRVVRESWTRTNGSSTAQLTEGVNYQYDLAGRLTVQAAVTYSGGVWSWGDKSEQRWNAYGDLEARGVNSGGDPTKLQEQFFYDNAGRLWKSNEGDGTWKIYVYDKAGNRTLTIASTSATTDLKDQTVAGALASVTDANNYVGLTDTGALNLTLQEYDKRGSLVSTRELWRETTAIGGSKSTLRTTRSYNAFGEVASETDARGTTTTTSFEYNTMGRLTRTVKPGVYVTDEHGVVSSALVNPIEEQYYDLGGRLIGTKDANGNVNKRLLLAGTGYGGAEAKTAKEFHADGGILALGYDDHLDMRKRTDEINRTTTYGYDKAGRLTTLTRPSGLLTESYAYDGLGHRTQHWNSQLGSGIKEKTDYDAQGRVTRTIDFSGYATGYTYGWVGTLATDGMTTVFGGWVKTTTSTALKADGTARTSNESTDYFGRTVDKVDLGGHDYAFGYDKAGRLVSQSNGAGQSKTISYYNTGRIAQIVTGSTASFASSTATSTFKYDVAGNRTYEGHSVTGTKYYFTGTGSTSSSYSTSHQSATAAWDALGRMTSFTDSGAGGVAGVASTYAYDLAGNVRRIYTTGPNMDDQGNLVTNGFATDLWYRYDSMNRFVITRGVLEADSNGINQIVRGAISDTSYNNNGTHVWGGREIAYNLAGERVLVKSSDIPPAETIGYEDPTGEPTQYPNTVRPRTITRVNTHTERYEYRDDGRVSKVWLTDSSVASNDTFSYAGTERQIANYTRDAMGRVTLYSEYDPDGTLVVFSRESQYDENAQLLWEKTVTKRSADTFVATTTMRYGLGADGLGVYQGGVVTHTDTVNTKNGNSEPSTSLTNSYAWWDGAQRSSIEIVEDGKTKRTDFYYDGGGNVATVKIDDDRDRTISFVNDSNGMVLERDERDAETTGDPRELHYYFDGVQIGDISNNGSSNVDYAESIWRHRAAPWSGPFEGGDTSRTFVADFDQSYDALNGDSYGSVSGGYTVAEGDTLQSIAQAVWGDAAMWYLLADANGLTGGEPLAAGRTLSIPNKVANVHNNADTFRPYDPNNALGDLSPTAPKPQKHGGCGMLGQIILVAIAVAVSIYTAGALSSLGAVVSGMIGGAVGSAASQAVGVVTGLQQKFSWKGVALGAISGAVSGAMKGVDILSKLGGSTVVSGAIRGAAGSALTQGIAVASGLQNKFSWAAVAAGAASGGIMKAIGAFMPDVAKLSAGYYGEQMVVGAAGALAGAAARTLIDGSDFGDNIMATLPEVIGNTLGNAFADGVAKLYGDPKPSAGGPRTAPAGSSPPRTEAELRLLAEQRLLDRATTRGNVQMAAGESYSPNLPTPDEMEGQPDIVVTGRRKNWFENFIDIARENADSVFIAPIAPMLQTLGAAADRVGLKPVGNSLRNTAALYNGMTSAAGTFVINTVDGTYKLVTDPVTTTKHVLGGVAVAIDKAIMANPEDVGAALKRFGNGLVHGGPEFYRDVGKGMFNTAATIASVVLPAARAAELGTLGKIEMLSASGDVAVTVERAAVAAERFAPDAQRVPEGGLGRGAAPEAALGRADGSGGSQITAAPDRAAQSIAAIREVEAVSATRSAEAITAVANASARLEQGATIAEVERVAVVAADARHAAKLSFDPTTNVVDRSIGQDLGRAIAADPIASASYSRLQKQGTDVFLTSNPRLSLLGYFEPTSNRVTINLARHSSVSEVVSTIVHEATHQSRFHRGANIFSQYQEYLALRNEALYQLGRRPTLAQRQAIWEQTKMLYPELPEGRNPFGE